MLCVNRLLSNHTCNAHTTCFEDMLLRKPHTCVANFAQFKLEFLAGVRVWANVDLLASTCLFGTLLITVRKRSCGKVIFSQACVKNSVHRGQVYTPPGRHSWQTPVWADTTPPGQTPHPWADSPQADTPLGRHPWTDTPGQNPTLWADTPPMGRHPSPPPPRKTDTAADGTHPTGMHSCLYKFLESNSDRWLVYAYENFGPV